ncbi:hypothetical protein FIBSPDRAFT_1017382 [Athelia psychrophila]|uniref:Uncharacterized protein n=1 Tax=Athelia psychrophila TaxID=1759441 RepID=A0A166VCH8_9AGAM|nr:hypothetical protein FIBSPDRAFT_1017382 [Fibularhizoctonia sp. CBS 109695]
MHSWSAAQLNDAKIQQEQEQLGPGGNRSRFSRATCFGVRAPPAGDAAAPQPKIWILNAARALGTSRTRGMLDDSECWMFEENVQWMLNVGPWSPRLRPKLGFGHWPTVAAWRGRPWRCEWPEDEPRFFRPGSQAGIYRCRLGGTGISGGGALTDWVFGLRGPIRRRAAQADAVEVYCAVVCCGYCLRWLHRVRGRVTRRKGRDCASEVMLRDGLGGNWDGWPEMKVDLEAQMTGAGVGPGCARQQYRFETMGDRWIWIRHSGDLGDRCEQGGVLE